MRAIYGLTVNEEKVLEDLRVIVQALKAGEPLVRVMPKPGEEPKEWSPSERRTARVLAAYIQGTLNLREVPLEVGLRLEELREDLGLGPWVKEVPRVLAHLVEGPSEKKATEVAAAILEGKKVAVKGARDLYFVERVAWILSALQRRKRAEEKVNRLLTAREDARVSPKDLKVIMGRIRAGRPVWVKATPEELRRLRDEVVEHLVRARPSFLPETYRYTSREDLPHPRVMQALRAVWEWIRGETAAAPTLPGESKRAWAHRSLAQDHEVEILLALGVEADWSDPASLRAALEPLRRRDALPERVYLGNLSRAALEEVDADEAGYADRNQVLRVISRVYRGTLDRPGRRAETPARSLARLLEKLRVLPQKEVRRLHREVLEGKKAALWKVAAQALPGALEVLLEFPDLHEDMLALGWAWALEAAQTQRSLKHHPAALAARLAKKQAPLLAEVKRQAFGLDEASLRRLQEVRRVLEKKPAATPEEIARRLGRPLEWVEEVVPLLRGRLALDIPVNEEGDLTVADTVSGGPEPEDIAERRELRRMVEEALGRLERTHGLTVRRAVEALYMDGLPLELAAEREGIPPEVLEDAAALGANFLREDAALRKAAEEVI
ncbi:sigma-70 domain-containing protein [Fervidobacterium sp.]